MIASPHREEPFLQSSSPFPRPVTKSPHGFSLVECALALGVVAFALVSIMGLMPLGLAAFSKAVDTSTGSRIVQQVVTDLQQSPTLPAQQPFRYFDVEGTRQASGSAQPGAPAPIYHVNTVVTSSSRLPGGEESNLATVLIEIAKNPKGETLERNSGTRKLVEKPGISIARFAVLIANKEPQP